MGSGGSTIPLDALANAREAFQARERGPVLSLDSDLPLPLAFLVGYEWRSTTRLRLRIAQRTGASFSWIEHSGPLGEEPTPVTRHLNGDAPVVVAVSCKDPLGCSRVRVGDVWTRTPRVQATRRGPCRERFYKVRKEAFSP